MLLHILLTSFHFQFAPCRKQIFSELKQVKGMKSFGAVNFWRYWRLLTVYPSTPDMQYTEVGPGTKRGLNIM